ncbi:MAG: DNA alkylation repair protein [Chloroflexi bacterium]|nr:DNA alkylation repair protein [Chloroflexota bacterium]MDA1147443.1 DNA alkylation repair protein [Chloroflexota bacterium]
MPDDPIASARADRLEADLRLVATAGRAERERAYLKSDLEFIGVRVPDLRRTVKAHLDGIEDLDHDALIALIEALWDSGIYERRAAAAIALEGRPRLLSGTDLPLLERLLRESKTWALVDGLAVHVVGRLRERDAGVRAELDRWAVDPDFWIRRSALLAHLLALRRGEGDFDTFGRYADGMLEEREFFIRKAIGWVLRETARKRPGLVIDWIAPRTARASGVTMREVVRHLPTTDAERLMEGYRGGRAAAGSAAEG